MALDDVFKNNVTTAVAVGVGAALLAPTLLPALGRVARPAAKAAIKGGILAYERSRESIAELGEMAEDTYAEARAELHEEARQAAAASAGAAAGAAAGGEAAETGANDGDSPAADGETGRG